MRALRTIIVWLLVAAASGSGPVVLTCAHLATENGCGDTCTRCWCKRHSPMDSLRAPCPCCNPEQGAEPMTLLPPAVLPSDAPALSLAPDTTQPAPAFTDAIPFTASVPHPPPRARLVG